MLIQNDLLNIRCPNLLKFRLPKSSQPKELSKSAKERQELIEHFLNLPKVDDFIKFAINNFHGISRKYLQFYLAKYKAVFQDDFMFPGKILRECLNHNNFSYCQMLEYVTPAVVSL